MNGRHPFWHWLLQAVAWSVLIAFVFMVVVSSIFTLVKLLQ